MNPESPVVAELKPLLDALCEGSITPEQFRRLEELIAVSAFLVSLASIAIAYQETRASKQLVQASSPFSETVDYPTAQAEQSEFLTRGRIHSQPVSIFSVTLRTPYLLGVAIPPDRALT